MRAASIVTRVTRGTVATALLTAVVLASASAAVALVVWRHREQRALQATAASITHAIQREAAEEHWTLAQAAPEAVRESGVGEYDVEVWQGARRLAARDPGLKLGPPARLAEGWLLARQAVPDGLTVLVGTRARDAEAIRVFAWSLLLAAPVCVLVALVIGRVVGRRSVQPLLAFRDAIVDATPTGPLPRATRADDPAEVAALAGAFAALWTRVEQARCREAEFAANASHELRTPLTRIRLHAERALGPATGEAVLELHALVAEVDRLARVVDSLLVMSRDVSGGLPRSEPVNVADAVRALAGHARQRIDLEGLCDEMLVAGDPDLLSIAIENLLDNAGKFGDPRQSPRVGVHTTAGRVGLHVTTPGARVAEADRDRLFERFYRPPGTPAEGHGLGLPLARHVARLHGGDVRCVSAEGEDATFLLELPPWVSGATPRG